MKVFILNRNYLTWPVRMAEKLASENHEVIFIDCGSNYAPLLEFYCVSEFQVIMLSNKLGNRSPWDAGIVTALNEPYVVTDPDFDLTPIPADWAEVLLEGFQQFPDKNKFGLSLDERGVPPENPAWIEDRFKDYPDGLPMTWGCGLPNNWYNYPCDTTFALQRPHTPGEIGGIRKGRPYTAVHLPWHITLEPSSRPDARVEICNDEIAYYFLTCENSSMTWGRMVRYQMIEQYLAKTGQTKESLISRYYRKGVE